MFFLVVAGFATVPAFTNMPGTLITEGDFYGDEMSAEAGSEWWALVSTEAGFVLRKSTISVETYFNACVENDESKPTGKRVRIAGRAASEHSVFFLKDIEGLLEGPMQN